MVEFPRPWTIFQANEQGIIIEAANRRVVMTRWFQPEDHRDFPELVLADHKAAQYIVDAVNAYSLEAP